MSMPVIEPAVRPSAASSAAVKTVSEKVLPQELFTGTPEVLVLVPVPTSTVSVSEGSATRQGMDKVLMMMLSVSPLSMPQVAVT